MSPTLEFHDISFRLNVQEREEEGIWLYVFSRILNIYTPRKASFYHFSPEKLASTVNFSEGGYTLSRSKNDKTSNIW